MSRKDDIEKLIINHNRRLQKLKEQQAIYGTSSDPGILIEIENIEAEIEKLQAELEHTVESDIQATSPRLNDIQSQMTKIDKTALRKFIIDHFDLEELRDLCFDLDIDFDTLRGEGMAAKVRELIAYAQRHDLSDRLISEIQQRRNLPGKSGL